MNSIRNVVFDIGNVLVCYDPKGFLEKFTSIESRDRIFKIVFGSEEWNDMDRGTLSEEDAFCRFAERNPDLSKMLRFVYLHWKDHVFSLNHPTSDVLKILKQKGYRIYLLSNFQEKGFKKIQRDYDFFKFIDGKVVSYEVKTIKPENRIYEILLEKYTLIPQETVFIDDNLKNVEAAAKYGILCHHYTRAEAFTQFIDSTLFGGEKGSTGMEE